MLWLFKGGREHGVLYCHDKPLLPPPRSPRYLRRGGVGCLWSLWGHRGSRHWTGLKQRWGRPGGHGPAGLAGVAVNFGFLCLYNDKTNVQMPIFHSVLREHLLGTYYVLGITHATSCIIFFFKNTLAFLRLPLNTLVLELPGT